MLAQVCPEKKLVPAVILVLRMTRMGRCSFAALSFASSKLMANRGYKTPAVSRFGFAASNRFWIFIAAASCERADDTKTVITAKTSRRRMMSPRFSTQRLTSNYTLNPGGGFSDAGNLEMERSTCRAG